MSNQYGCCHIPVPQTYLHKLWVTLLAKIHALLPFFFSFTHVTSKIGPKIFNVNNPEFRAHPGYWDAWNRPQRLLMPGPKALTNQIVSSAHDDVGLWAQVGPTNQITYFAWAHVGPRAHEDIEKLETVFDAGPEFWPIILGPGPKNTWARIRTNQNSCRSGTNQITSNLKLIRLCIKRHRMIRHC